MDPDQVKAAIEALKNNDAAAALTILEALIVTAAGGNAAEEAAEGEPPADPLAASAEPTPEQTALSATLVTLTGAAGPAEQTAFLAKLLAERGAHAEHAAALELSSRYELVGELVKLNVEYPATAFVGDPVERKLVPRLANEPIADLRARVVAVKAAKGAKQNIPPTRGGGEVVTLSAVDVAAAKKAGMTAEQFIAAKKNAVKRT